MLCKMVKEIKELSHYVVVYKQFSHCVIFLIYKWSIFPKKQNGIDFVF